MSKDKFEFQDDEVYPVECSTSGANAFYLNNCEHVGHRPAYAACLKKVADRKHGRLETIFADCSAAIGRKECPAAKMRKEELAEGKAMYFIPRTKLQAYAQYKAEMAEQRLADILAGVPKEGRGVSKQAPASRPATKPSRDIDTGGSYADAINRALQAQTKPEEKPRSELKVRPPMMVGETPMQYARRIAALNA